MACDIGCGWRLLQASKVLMSLRDGENVDDEMDEIQASVLDSEETEGERVKFSDLLSTPPLRRALILGCGLMLLQQLSGINTVMYYSATIYSMAGFAKTAAIWLAGFTAGAQVSDMNRIWAKLIFFQDDMPKVLRG